MAATFVYLPTVPYNDNWKWMVNPRVDEGSFKLDKSITKSLIVAELEVMSLRWRRWRSCWGFLTAWGLNSEWWFIRLRTIKVTVLQRGHNLIGKTVEYLSRDRLGGGWRICYKLDVLWKVYLDKSVKVFVRLNWGFLHVCFEDEVKYITLALWIDHFRSSWLFFNLI